MKIRKGEGFERLNWRYLLSPEDTTVGKRPIRCFGRYERWAGCLKSVWWLAVAILSSIAVGQL